MAWNLNVSDGTETGATPAEPTSAEPISLVTLASNIQSGLNATQVSWTNIDWSLFPARPGFPDYTVTHDLGSVSVFVPIAAEAPEFIQATDADGTPLTETITSGGTLSDSEIVVRDAAGAPLQEYVVIDLFGNIMGDDELLSLAGYTLVDADVYKFNEDNSELLPITEKVLADNLGTIITPDNVSVIGNYTIREVPFYLRKPDGSVKRADDGAGLDVPIEIGNSLYEQQTEFVLMDPFGQVMPTADAVALGFSTKDIQIWQFTPQADGTVVDTHVITETVLVKPNGSFWAAGDIPFLSSNVTLSQVDFLVRNNGDIVTEPKLTGGTTAEVPVLAVDEFGNNIRIVDFTNDLFLALGGTDGDDHLRNKDFSFPDGTGEQSKLTGALMGFSGDDVLYSENIFTPMLMGGSGDDSYILDGVTVDVDATVESAVFVQIVEQGNDDNDSLISYNNDWAFAGDIDGQHLILADETQTDIVIIWDYNAPNAKIENFWFDFDNNGINEHYNFDEFIGKLHQADFWFGSVQSEALGISRTTMTDLTQAISEAVTLSKQIEDFRNADEDTALSIARLYQAAFDRTPDEGGMNFWIDQWETVNLSIAKISDEFYISAEFTDTYGSLDNNEYVTQLYANVLNRTPDQAGLDFWINGLQNGASEAEVLLEFSNSLENKINTELQLSGLVEVTPGEWVL